MDISCAIVVSRKGEHAQSGSSEETSASITAAKEVFTMTLQALIETGITADFLASAGWPLLMIFLTGLLFRTVLEAK